MKKAWDALGIVQKLIVVLGAAAILGLWGVGYRFVVNAKETADAAVKTTEAHELRLEALEKNYDELNGKIEEQNKTIQQIDKNTDRNKIYLELLLRKEGINPPQGGD